MRKVTLYWNRFDKGVTDPLAVRNIITESTSPLQTCIAVLPLQLHVRGDQQKIRQHLAACVQVWIGNASTSDSQCREDRCRQHRCVTYSIDMARGFDIVAACGTAYAGRCRQHGAASRSRQHLPSGPPHSLSIAAAE